MNIDENIKVDILPAPTKRMRIIYSPDQNPCDLRIGNRIIALRIETTLHPKQGMLSAVFPITLEGEAPVNTVGILLSNGSCFDILEGIEHPSLGEYKRHINKAGIIK